MNRVGMDPALSGSMNETYIFKAQPHHVREIFSERYVDGTAYVGQPCRVTCRDAVIGGGTFETNYHDIEFADGMQVFAVSGLHLKN